MATQQNEGGVAFAVAHDFVNFRLLELPPELVPLLDTPNPPPCAPSFLLFSQQAPPPC